MKALFMPYLLRLRAPVLVTTAEGDPNSVRSALAVPGSTVRGAVAARLVKAGRSELEVREIVAGGSVRFLPARVLPPGNDGLVRPLPIPASWMASKADPFSLVDLAIDAEADEADDALVAPQGPSFVPGADFVLPAITMRALVHNQRDRVRGRPTEQVGALFLYEALDTGTCLHGVVAAACAPEKTAQEYLEFVRKAIESGLELGRSKQTGYGGNAELVRTYPSTERELDGTVWADVLADGPRKGDIFRLLFTAPVVVRDRDTGQVDPAGLGDAVVRSLGVRVIRSFYRTRRLSGFNTLWRLAAVQDLAIEAGALLVLEAKRDIDMTELLDVEARGLGERRAEGFGACLFLRAPTTGPVRLVNAAQAAAPARPVGGPENPLLGRVQERLFEQAIDTAVVRLTAQLIGDAIRIPPRALLGRLRVPLRRGEPGLAELRRWILGSMQGKGAQVQLAPPALKKVRECRLGGGCFLDEWLRTVTGTEQQELDALAADLFRGTVLQHKSISGTVSQNQREGLATRARVRLAESVLAALAKKGGDRG